MSSSSSDDSADARELDESVQLPVKNPPAVVPARQQSEEEDDQDAQDSGSEASEEGEEESGTEASEEDGRTSDEDYEDEVVEDSEPDEPLPLPPRTNSRGKLLPTPQAPPSPDLTKPSVVKRNAAAAGLAESTPSKKRAPPAARTKSLPLKPVEKKLPPPEDEAAKEEVTKTAAPKAAARRGRRNKSPTKAAATDGTKSPPSKSNKAAPAATEHDKEVVKSPKPNKKSPNKVGGDKSPPAPTAAANAPTEGGQVEKSARYSHLRKEVGLLEEANNNPGVLDAAFLEMDDDKAAMLNSKIFKQKLAEIKVKNDWWDIKKEVTKALLDTINK